MKLPVVAEKFIKYVKIDTQSREELSDKVPSTEKQRDLALVLYQELKEMGASQVRYDEEHSYVYAVIPSNLDKEVPAIGFIAHMDTSDAVSGTNVKPRFIENYDGEDIVLNEEKHIVTHVHDFPMLKDCKGKTLIVTDGTTLLGGDDKAGVAEIMTMAEYFLSHPEVKHGKICIGFTPDEEVGNGVEYFDIKGFGADYAYTVDGGELGDMSYECFHAASARVTVHGKSVHPGTAKNVMKNAIKLAYECTEGYEGFYHVTDIKGTVEEATVDFIIRDHDRAIFEKRKEVIAQAAEKLNKVYGETIFEVEIKDSYHNMKEMIEKEMHVVDNLKEAMLKAGVTPKVSPIRGGTDGARLSFMGLPCPNLGTGGYAFHGPCEHITVEGMDYAVENLKNIVKLYAY